MFVGRMVARIIVVYITLANLFLLSDIIIERSTVTVINNKTGRFGNEVPSSAVHKTATCINLMPIQVKE